VKELNKYVIAVGHTRDKYTRLLDSIDSDVKRENATLIKVWNGDGEYEGATKVPNDSWDVGMYIAGASKLNDDDLCVCLNDSCMRFDGEWLSKAYKTLQSGVDIHAYQVSIKRTHYYTGESGQPDAIRFVRTHAFGARAGIIRSMRDIKCKAGMVGDKWAKNVESHWHRGHTFIVGDYGDSVRDDNSERYELRRKKVNVIIPLGKGSKADNEEARYAIRSMVENLRDLGEIIIVGEYPSWCKGLKHIPMDDIRYPIKDCNIIAKLKKAVEDPAMTEKFIYWCDDMMLLQRRWSYQLPVSVRNIYTNPDDSRYVKTGWFKALKKTHERFGIGSKYYEPHTPMYCDTAEFLKMCDEYNWKNGGCITHTLYYNYAKEKPYDNDTLHTYSPKGTVQDIIDKVDGKTIVGYTDNSRSDVLRWAEKYFPKQSRYELDTPKGILGNAIETALKHTGPEWNVLKVKANAFKREFEGRYTKLGCNDRKRVNKEFLIPMQALNHGVVKKKAPCSHCGGKAKDTGTRDCIACTEKHIEKAQVLIDEWYLNNEYIAELSAARGNLGCAEDHIVRIDKSLACSIRDARLIISRGGTYDVGRVYKLLRSVLDELGRR